VFLCTAAFFLVYFTLAAWVAANFLVQFDGMIKTEVLPLVEEKIEQLVIDMMEQDVVMYLFETALNAGEVEAAYSFTTDDFRARQTRGEFSEFVTTHRELRLPWRDGQWEFQVEENVCTYSFSPQLEDGKRATFKIVLAKENNIWRVDQIILP
jgi:hypothetical protein